MVNLLPEVRLRYLITVFVIRYSHVRRLVEDVQVRRFSIMPLALYNYCSL